MPESTVAAEVLSQIPFLEPLAGISLAINLAYLNLRRWRYREEIRQIAKKGLEDLDQASNDNGGAVSQLSQLRGLKVLAGASKTDKRTETFIKVFEFIFGKEVDVYSSFSFSVFAAIILCVGVAHNVNTAKFLLPISGAWFVVVYFWILIASLVGPSLFVLLGRYLSRMAKEYSAQCFSELSSVYASKIGELPSAPALKVPASAAAARQEAAYRTAAVNPYRTRKPTDRG